MTFQFGWPELILPQLELENVYNQLDFTKRMCDQPNETTARTVLPVFACPTDPWSASPILPERGWSPSFPVATLAGYGNPDASMGLWYTGSIGPTHPDGCSLCPDSISSATNWCCQGNSWGSIGPPANAVGVFHRYPKGISFDQVTDGLSNTLMVGETLPSQCAWNGVFCFNQPLSSTSVPIETMYSDGTLDGGGYDTGGGYTWSKACGFKSLHADGVNFAMADGSVHFLSLYITHQVFCALGTRAGGEVVEVP